jgi:hypothetical protein
MEREGIGGLFSPEPERSLVMKKKGKKEKGPKKGK